MEAVHGDEGGEGVAARGAGGGKGVLLVEACGDYGCEGGFAWTKMD